MKLPHISIEYRDEETFAPDKMSLSLVCGFGLHWAWVWLVIFNGPGLFYPANPQLFASVFVATIVIFAITLSCYGIFLKQFRAFFSTPQKRMRNRAVGMCFVIVGTALLWLLNAESPLWLFLGASALFNGIGSAILIMSYGVSMGVLDIAEAVSATAAGLFVATVCFVLLMAVQQLAAPAGAVLCLVLPVGEFICLWHCSRQLVDRMEFGTATLSVHTMPFVLHVCGPMLVLGVVLGFLRPLALFEVHLATPWGSAGISYVLAGILVAILAILAMVLQRQSNNFMFRTLFPVCAAFFLVLCMANQPSAALQIFALFSIYLMLEACSWVMLSDISQRFRISAFTTFGFGRAALAVGALVGYVACAHTPTELGFLDQLNFLALLALALMLLGMALLPKNAELRKTLKLGKSCPALQGDEQFAFVSNSEFKQVTDNMQESPVSREPASQIEPVPLQNDEYVEEDEGANEITDGKARMEAIDAIQERVNAEEREKKRQGRFKRKCAMVADTYLLSRKETEVLFLLAKGRNAAAIQEQLYISAGTANTHMRHIYRKLNVHSQQELIALVEETEVDDIDWTEQ